MDLWIKAGIRDFTLLSRQDFDRLHNKTITVTSQGKGGVRCYVDNTPLARYIMNCPSDKEVDHIDRDPMNNTRQNLRICNHQQNSQNKWVYNKRRTSNFKGILIKKCGSIHWETQDRVKGIKYRSKKYISEKFAYNDYCNYKKENYGDYFMHKDLSEFPLEKVLPRKASVNNISGFIGVCPNNNSTQRPWRCTIKTGGKQKIIGYFKCKVEAARAFDKEAFAASGMFSRLNFPEEYAIFL